MATTAPVDRRDDRREAPRPAPLHASELEIREIGPDGTSVQVSLLEWDALRRIRVPDPELTGCYFLG